MPPHHAVIGTAVDPPDALDAGAFMFDGEEVHSEYPVGWGVFEAASQAASVGLRIFREQVGTVGVAIRQDLLLDHLGEGLIVQGEQAGCVGVLECAYAGCCGSHNTQQDAFWGGR